MEHRIFFSVIIPTYNRATLISRAIESVLQQSYRNWELLVVDDGSTDDTKLVVKSFQDSRIKYFEQEHSERSMARNLGIENALGEYLCFLDSDDFYLDFHLQTFHEHIEKNNYAEAVYFCNTSESCGGVVKEQPFKPRPSLNNVEFVLLNLIGVPRTCISRKTLSNFRFNTGLSIGEDREFLARIVAKFPIIHIPIATQVIVVHSEQSTNIGNYESYMKNLITARYLATTFGEHLSNDAKKYILAKGYNGMIEHNLSVGMYLRALYWFLRLCICNFSFVRKQIFGFRIFF